VSEISTSDILFTTTTTTETPFIQLTDQSRIGDGFGSGTETCQLIEHRGRLSQLHIQPIAELVQIGLQVPLP
jgi:hypothetical protein